MELKEDISSRRKGKAPFLLVALGAIFLLVATGIVGILSERPERVFLANTATPLENSFDQIAAHGTPIVPETPELVLLGRTGVKAAIPPVTVTPQVLGAIVGGLETGVTPEILRYVVEEGDTSASLAERFQISVNTILWVNNLSNSSTLSPGKELIILPTSGTLHLVRPYDTLSEIALWYKGSTKKITRYNGLESAGDIYAGDLIIIPDGVMPRTLPAGRLTPLANSYFIYPIPAPHRITQALHPFNAIDFSNGFCGEPIYAAAGGTIQRTGYHSAAGNFVRILHPNGVVTYYGHLSRFTVSAGGRVFQGEIVGYTGHSGYTIPAGPAGCHLHFGVRGASNPFR